MTVAGQSFVPVADSVERIVAHIEGTARTVAEMPVDPSRHVKSEEHRRQLLEMYRRAADAYRERRAGR